MAKPRGLQKSPYSVVLSEGLSEGIDSYVVAGAKLLAADNVEMDRQGRATKRLGFAAYDPGSLAPQAPYTSGTGTPYAVRVESVDGELLAVTRTALHALSPTAGKFVMKGEAGSFKGEMFAGFRETNLQYNNGDCVASNGYVLAAFSMDDIAGGNQTMYSNIYDEVTGGALFTYKQIQATTAGGLNTVRTLRCGVGDRDIIALYDETGNTLYAANLNTANLTGAWTATAIVPGGGTGCQHFDACSIGTAGYVVAFFDSVGSKIRVQEFTPAGAMLAAITPIAVVTCHAIAVAFDGTYVHVVYHDGRIRYRKYTLALGTLVSSCDVKVAPALTAAGTNARVGVVPNGSNALVVWGESALSAAFVTADISVTFWREVNTAAGTLNGVEQHQPYYQLASRPFVYNDNYHFMLQSEMWNYAAIGAPTGTSDNPGQGLFLYRVHRDVLSTTAAEGLVVSAVALGSGIGGKITERRAPRQMLAGTGGVYYTLMDVLGPTIQNNANYQDYQPNIYKFSPQAVGMSKPLVLGGSKLLLGGVPSVYDGTAHYNVGSFVPPVILHAVGAGGGSLTASKSYGVIVVEEWLDDDGNAVYSETSLPATVALTAGQTLITIAIRPSGIENKRDWWPTQQTFAQRRLSIYRTEADGDKYYYEAAVILNRYATDWYVFNVSLADTAVRTKQQIYTVGGEVPNTGLPSCHVGCSVGRRLLVRSDEDKRRMYYSKPLQKGRPVEFDVNFSMLDFPEDIVAAGSLDGAPVAFGRDQVYIVDGVGPGPSNQPAGAWAIRTLAGAVGCVDQESAVSLPTGGILFRAKQGFYLLTGGGFEFVGTGVYDTALAYPTTLQTLVDDANGVVKFLVAKSDGTTIILCYYWLTKQWTVHSPVIGSNLKSFCLHNGDYYGTDEDFGIEKTNASSFKDAGNGYPMRVRFGWENAGDIQSRKRFWEVQPLLRAKNQNHQLRAKLFYNRLDSDVDTFDFPVDAITNLTAMEKLRVQLPHARGLSDCLSVQLEDVGDIFGPLTAVGAAPLDVTLTGVPDASVTQIVISISVAGDIGHGKFFWSKDGGATWSTETTLQSSIVLTGSGATAHFPAGAYDVDQYYYWYPTFWGQGFDVIGLTYVLGVKPGAVKLSKERTA